MIRYETAHPDQAELLTRLRLEVLRAVNGLPEDAVFPPERVDAIHAYWQQPDQVTVLAMDGDEAVACATLCYIRVMPTFDHPTGLRGHVMNVYTRKAYRRQGIARQLLRMLTEDAKRRGATELSLDATEDGRLLYQSLGFTPSREAMTLKL